MRIIAGEWGGRRLKAPPGTKTRPTTDRAREGIFNVLQNKVLGSRVLDAFAGSGAMGIEALSRGAASAVFVEADAKAAAVLRENLSFLPADREYRLIFGDCCKMLYAFWEKFDIIFIDPPYNRGWVDRVTKLIALAELLAPNGVLVLETAAKEQELPDLSVWQLIKESRYGDSAVLYFTNTGGHSDG